MGGGSQKELERASITAPTALPLVSPTTVMIQGRSGHGVATTIEGQAHAASTTTPPIAACQLPIGRLPDANWEMVWCACISRGGGSWLHCWWADSSAGECWNILPSLTVAWFLVPSVIVSGRGGRHRVLPVGAFGLDPIWDALNTFMQWFNDKPCSWHRDSLRLSVCFPFRRSRPLPGPVDLLQIDTGATAVPWWGMWVRSSF